MHYIYGIIPCNIKVRLKYCVWIFSPINTKPGICYLCPIIKMVFFCLNTVMAKKIRWHFYVVCSNNVTFVFSFLLNFEEEKAVLKLYTTVKSKPMVRWPSSGSTIELAWWNDCDVGHCLKVVKFCNLNGNTSSNQYSGKLMQKKNKQQTNKQNRNQLKNELFDS